MTEVVVRIPMRLASAANGSHGHWRTAWKRAKAQRTDVFSKLLWPLTRFPRSPAHCVVTLTRIGVRDLDSDNLAYAFKHVRDGVADALGAKDNDPRIQWRYAQERGKPKEYAIRIEIQNVTPYQR